MTNPTLWRDPIPVESIRLSGVERALILSDIHLGDGTSADPFGHKDQSLIELLKTEMERSELLLIGGDVMDCFSKRRYRRIPVAHRELIDLLRGYARDGRLYGVWGNHDKAVVLYDLIPDARFTEAIFVDDRTLLIHGHQCDFHFDKMAPGSGPTSIMNFHGFLEATLKRPIRLPFRDYDNRLNSLVHFGFYWLMRVRLYHSLAQLRKGNSDPAARWLATDNFWARGQSNDLGELMLATWLFLCENEIGKKLDTVLMGHSHIPGVVRFDDHVRPNLHVDQRFDHYIHHRSRFPLFNMLRKRYQQALAEIQKLSPRLPDVHSRGTFVNLGSWVHDSGTYAIYDRGDVKVFDFLNQNREIRDENYRLVTGRRPLPSTGEWFRRYTRGLARYDADAAQSDFLEALATC